MPLAVALLAASSLSAQDVRDATPLGSLTDTAYSPSVATDGEVSVVCWQNSITKELLASSSDGRGLTWSAPVRIDDDTTLSNKYLYNHMTAAGNGNVYVVWRDRRDTPGGTMEEAYFTASHDGGATWLPNIRLDNGAAVGTMDTDEVEISADGDHVYVLIRANDATGGEGEFLVSSHDAGMTWSTALRADPDLGDCDDETVTCNGMDVYVAWCDDRNALYDDDVFFTMSHDGGLTWMGPEMQLDASGPANGDVDYGMNMKCVGSEICLIWEEDELPSSAADEEIHFIYSDDGGHNWWNEVTVTTGFDSDGAMLAYDGTNILIAYEGNSTLVDEIWVSQANDPAAPTAWTATMLSTATAQYPVVVGDVDYWSVVGSGAGTPQTPWAVSSHDGGWYWGGELDCANGTQPTGDTDFMTAAYNTLYDNTICAWLSDDLGQNTVYVGGYRSQGVTAVSPSFTTGDTINFMGHGFGNGNIGLTGLVLATLNGSGSYMLPFGDNRNTGLMDNPYIPLYMGMFSGGIDPIGKFMTPTLTIPALPAGATLHYCAVALDLAAGVSFGSLTDAHVATIN